MEYTNQIPLANAALRSISSETMGAEDMKNYIPEFQMVFSQPDMRNIGISGTPAANKVGVVNSWKAQHSPKTWINVSAPRFGGDSPESEASVEDALINQIVCQMSLAKSPKTRFRNMMKRNYALDLAIAFVCAAFVALTIFLIWIAGLLPSSRPPMALCVLALAAWLGCIAFGVFQIVRSNAIGRLLERFKLRGNDIELASGENDSRLERYMGDLVYLLNTNDYDNIIFEDLEANRNLALFERLRALNTLANTQRRGTRETLRFFYIVNDGIMDNPHDRASFFDHIIPVIPYVDPSNSFALFKNGLAEAGIAVDDEFLSDLSRYIDDPSILRDIVNESRHYKRGLFGDGDPIDGDMERLITLLTHKALFPRDFELLQNARGYLHALLKSRTAIIEELHTRLSRKTGELEDALAKAEKSKDDASIVDIKAQIDELKHTDVENSRKTLAQLLGDMTNPDAIMENPPYNIGLGKEYLSDVLESPYYPFIRFAVLGGWIDNTYERFLSGFYAESLSAADRELVNAIAQGRSVAVDQKVDSPFAVASRLDTDALPWENVRVYALLDHLLSYGPSDKLRAMLVGVDNDDDLEWIVGFTELDSFNRAVFSAVERFLEEPISRIMKGDQVTTSRKKRFAHLLLAYGRDALDSKSAVAAIREFAESDPTFLRVEAVEPLAIAKGLSKIEFRAKELDLDSCDLQLVQYIYDNDLYEPNALIIDTLTSFLLEIEPALPKGLLVSRIYSFDDTAVKSIVANNAELLLDSLVKSTPGKLGDSSDAIAWILGCKGVTPQTALAYLRALSDAVAIDDITSITSPTFQGVLFERGLVANIPENILHYFAASGNSIDENLAAFLEDHTFPANFTMATTERLLGSESGFLEAVITCRSLSDDKVAEISSTYRAQFNHFDIHGLSESRLERLITNGVIRATPDNLRFARQTCPSAARFFVRTDAHEYAKLVLPDEYGEPAECGFVRSEVLDILALDDVDDSAKIELLSGFSEPVSMSKAYSNEVNAAIASNFFNVQDFPKLDELYERGNRKLKRAIAEAIVAHRVELAESRTLFSMDLVTDVTWRLRGSRAAMIEFVAQQLTRRQPEPTRLEVRVVFERAGLREYVALLHGPSALIPSSPEDDRLLNALSSIGMAGKQVGKPDWQGMRRVNSKGFSRK